MSYPSSVPTANDSISLCYQFFVCSLEFYHLLDMNEGIVAVSCAPYTMACSSTITGICEILASTHIVNIYFLLPSCSLTVQKS